jgi:3-hydroxyacyl-CoA dehydrogenase
VALSSYSAGKPSDAGPFRTMDQVGLDVVLDIKEHYPAVRPDVSDGPQRLLRDYIARRDLGAKNGAGSTATTEPNRTGPAAKDDGPRSRRP